MSVSSLWWQFSEITCQSGTSRAFHIGYGKCRALKPICFYCLRHSITVLKSKCAGKSTLACKGQRLTGLNLVKLWLLRRTVARPTETKQTALLSSTTQWMKTRRKSWLCVFPSSTNFMTQVDMHTETLGGNNTSVHLWGQCQSFLFYGWEIAGPSSFRRTRAQQPLQDKF